MVKLRQSKHISLTVSLITLVFLNLLSMWYILPEYTHCGKRV